MTAQDVIRQADHVPAVSPAAIRLVRLLGGEPPDAAEVLDSLRCDPALTARLLRICNSAAVALRQQVHSVDQALLLLGYQRLYELVLKAAFGETLTAAIPTYAIEARTLWRHSVITAHAAEHLALEDLASRVPSDLAFTVGLLHDIGKTLLAPYLDPSTTDSIRRKVLEGGLTRDEAERAVLGTDHAEVGAVLMSQWGLPEPIVHGIREHHRPCSGYHPPICVVVHLANCLAHTFGADAGWEALANRVDYQAHVVWDLTPARLEQLLLQLATDMHRIEQSMELV